MLNMLKPGEIILFKQPHAWYERLICYATHGPYFHVAIALDNNHIIEATSKGIQVNVAPREQDNAITYDTIDIVAYVRTAYSAYRGLPDEIEQNIGKALGWAQDQVGKIKYGWLDIAFQAVKFVAPNNPFQLVRHDRWDCSDFVTRVLIEMEFPLPEMYQDPYQNTPNDIARLFNLLPMRKAVVA